jgi:5-hydroxyisourate hydrolase
VAGGISIHGVDVARGLPAEGLEVELHHLGSERTLVASGRLGSDGVLDHPSKLGHGITGGTYEALFHIGDWLRATGYPEDQLGFLDTVPFRFVVADVERHYHLPLKFTPWGIMLFRGS